MNQADQAIKIGIVDDEELIVRLLEDFFSSKEEIEVILTANSGESLMRKLATLEMIPDILLLDLRMEKMNGLEVTEILKKEYPSIQVIVISSYYKKTFIGYMLKTGVNAFLPKGIHPNQLREVIRAVHQTGHYFLPEQVEILRGQVAPKAPKPSLQLQNPITDREIEVLSLICQQLTSQEIADKLFISKRTVEGHKTRLLTKTGMKNTAGLIIFAIQRKLVDISQVGF